MSRQHLWRACKKGAPKPPKNESKDLFEPFKSDFDKVVKNVALENEKCNYNPDVDMNWCNLSMEMRLDCLKRMDFKTRSAFRGVSKSEKTLVELEKYQFKHLIINFESKVNGDRWIGWDIIAKSGNEEAELHIRTDNCLNEKCLSAIFKHAEVKNLCLNAEDMFECNVLLEQLVKFAPFPFKRVSVFGNRSIDFFMKNCPNLEKIDVYRHLPYKEMLKLPSILKIEEFKFRGVSSSDLLKFLSRLVQKWIDNDAEIGKSVQFLLGVSIVFPFHTHRLVDTFAEKFADRIIEKTENELHIRMNNPKTQILMRIPFIEGEFNNQCLELCSLKVVPIDLPESEYGKEYEWVQALYENSLEEDGVVENPMEIDPEDQAIWGTQFFF